MDTFYLIINVRDNTENARVRTTATTVSFKCRRNSPAMADAPSPTSHPLHALFHGQYSFCSKIHLKYIIKIYFK
jgi:hypothetical protein